MAENANWGPIRFTPIMGHKFLQYGKYRKMFSKETQNKSYTKKMQGHHIVVMNKSTYLYIVCINTNHYKARDTSSYYSSIWVWKKTTKVFTTEFLQYVENTFVLSTNALGTFLRGDVNTKVFTSRESKKQKNKAKKVDRYVRYATASSATRTYLTSLTKCINAMQWWC